jgi:actin-like ATPase involved in cell morphogenesis
MPYRLGIDLGTTNTVATVAVDDALVELLDLGVDTPHTRSALFLADDGQLLVGDTVVALDTTDPQRLIVDPRRQLGTDLPLVVGGQQMTAEHATAKLLGFVRDRATAQQGHPPTETVLSYPAHWSEYQLDCFDRAIAAADLGPVRRCTEAEAAATTYATRNSLAEGHRVAVFDLGGGSFEVSVLERTPTGFHTVGPVEHSDHPSGADFDEAVFRLVLSSLGERGRDLSHDNPDARAQLAEVRRRCTQAKQDLSTKEEATVTVSLPGYTTTVRLSRQEFESLNRPALRQSISMTTRALRAADVEAADLAAIALVGGCCRMPIVAELLEREYKVPIAVGADPEYDVAFGALLMLDLQAVPAHGHVAAPANVSSPPVSTSAAPSVEEVAAPSLVVEVPAVAEEMRSVDDPPGVVDDVDDLPTEPLPAVVPMPPATEGDDPSGSVPDTPAPSQEETMANHLIFDYFSSTDPDPDETFPDAAAEPAPPAPPVAASWPPPAVPQASAAASPPSAGTSSPPTSTALPPVQPPWGNSPRRLERSPLAQSSPPQPPPGQRPPGQRPPGRRMAPPGPRGPQTQPYGTRGPGGPGRNYPPGPGGPGSGPFGSRGRMIMIIVGIVALAGAAFGIGMLVSNSKDQTATPAPAGSATGSSPTSAGTPTPGGPSSPGGPASPGGPTSPGGGETSPPSVALPASAVGIPESVVVVPMARGDDIDRALYLVDTARKISRVKLPTPSGRNANPMMQPSRNTIVYLNSGVLRVKAADGTGEDRKLFDRDPAGCDNVEQATWSVADPNVMLIDCRVSKRRDALLMVGMDGLLIRRLDFGDRIINDVSLSPDGQTALFWSSDTRDTTGGRLYTLPIIGTGERKQLTDGQDGEDADPAWSPDSTQIAFRRTGGDGNEDVYVMRSDGTGGARAVAETAAADFKPSWSPDNKNLLIISNRKSTSGGPGKTYDLWLIRVSDGEVLTQMGVKAKQITRPFWTLR